MQYLRTAWGATLLFCIITDMVGFVKVMEAPGCSPSTAHKPHNTSDLPHYKIAIVSLSIMPTVERLISAFTTTLENEGKCTIDFRIYDPRTDRNLLRSQVEDIFTTHYDLVYSLGLTATSMLKEVSERRHDTTPIVFDGVVTPVRHGLIASLEQSGNNLTGVVGDFNYTLYANLVCTLKKDMHRALIVYDPAAFGGTIEEWKNKVQAVLEERNILVNTVEVFHVDEIVKRVTPHMQNVDMLITLEDSIAMNGIKHLSKLCDMYGIPLMGAKLELMSKGTAACFGMFGYKTGVLAAHLAQQILEKGTLPTDIPICDIGREWQLILNTKAMKRQKLELTSSMAFLIRHTFVVGDTARH